MCDTHGKERIPKCFQGYVIGQDGLHGIHKKAILCGKEWCVDCGESNSWIHERRKASWRSKAFTWKGYFAQLVITIPKSIAYQFTSRKELNQVRTYWRRKLKREGYSQGLMRWHFTGDCPCKKKKKAPRKNCPKCHGTGKGQEYQPHLNCLLHASELPRATLNRWREEYYRFLRCTFGCRSETSVIHYSYWETGRYKKGDDRTVKHDQKWLYIMMSHKIEYITRATILDENMKCGPVTEELQAVGKDGILKRIPWTYITDIKTVTYNYRSSSIWGKWKSLKKHEIEAIMDLIATEDRTPEQREHDKRRQLYAVGISPFNGTQIKWRGFVRGEPDLFQHSGFDEYTRGGYFYCGPKPPKWLRRQQFFEKFTIATFIARVPDKVPLKRFAILSW